MMEWVIFSRFLIFLLFTYEPLHVLMTFLFPNPSDFDPITYNHNQLTIYGIEMNDFNKKSNNQNQVDDGVKL